LSSADSIRGFGGALKELSQRGLSRVHVAAVCYRINDSSVEFLLVRTRGGRWTFPKGGVDCDRTYAHAAAREAYEEAGVIGIIAHDPFTRYRHAKYGPLGTINDHEVIAYLCEVVHLSVPLEPYRTPTWFSAEDAKRFLRENRHPKYATEAGRVIDVATHTLRSCHSSN
jgi:8-oxo-dGTP pyrophosphatase MutT (NUDIX family)